MKRTVRVAVFVMMMVMALGIMCFGADRMEVNDENDFENYLKAGGEAVINENITYEIDEGLLLAHNEYIIDLDGNNLTMYCKGYSVDGNMYFMNGRVRFFGTDGSSPDMSVRGVLGIWNGTLDLGKTNLKWNKEGSYFVQADTSRSTNLTFPSRAVKTVPATVLDIDRTFLTKDSYVEMMRSGKLPDLTSDGYSFDGWKDKNGNTVTSWKGTTKADQIHL